MKCIHLYTLFLMLVFHTSCEPKQTNPPQDEFSREHNGLSQSQIKEMATSMVPRAQVRHIKQARNGGILIAATWSGAFRYDGKSFTNLTSKLSSHPYWDILEDRRGNIWFASLDSGVYYYNGKTFQHFTTREGLVNNGVMCIYEDKAGISPNCGKLLTGSASKGHTKYYAYSILSRIQTCWQDWRPPFLQTRK